MAPTCEVDVVLATPVWEVEGDTEEEDEEGEDEEVGMVDEEPCVEDVCDVDTAAEATPPEGVYSM